MDLIDSLDVLENMTEVVETFLENTCRTRPSPLHVDLCKEYLKPHCWDMSKCSVAQLERITQCMANLVRVHKGEAVMDCWSSLGDEDYGALWEELSRTAYLIRHRREFGKMLEIAYKLYKEDRSR